MKMMCFHVNLAILSTLVCGIVCDNVIRKIPVKINAGAYIQRLPNMTFYETNLPILVRLKYEVPLAWLQCKSLLINADKYEGYFPHWGLFYRVLSNADLATEEDLNELVHDDGEMWLFPLVTRTHVKNIFVTDSVVDGLVNRLKRDFEIGEFGERQYNGAASHRCNDSSSAEAVIALQAHRMEGRRQRVLEMCHSKKMDPYIIPLATLRSKLNSLRLSGSLSDYVPALNSTGAYYTLPLVECIISPSHVALGIHVPLIRRKMVGLTLQRISTPSYGWYGTTCSLELDVVELAVKRNGPDIEIMVPRCDPFRDELCLVTETTEEHEKSDLCARLIIRGAATEEFLQACPLVCRETGQSVSLVSVLPNQRFLITRAMQIINVTCNQSRWSYEPGEDIGLLDIGVPCGCILREGGREMATGYPCTNGRAEPTVDIVIPVKWSSLRGIRIPAYDEKPLEFTQMTECLNFKWKTRAFDWRIITIVILITILGSYVILLTIYLYFSWYRSGWSTPMAVSTGRVDSYRARPMPLPRPLPTQDDSVSEIPSSSGYVTPTPRQVIIHGGSTLDVTSEPGYDVPQPHYVPMMPVNTCQHHTYANQLA